MTAPIASPATVEPMAAASADMEATPRRILGFTPRDFTVLLAFLVLTIWSIWATRELLELRQRRIVSVSLSTIIKDFITTESRNPSSPDVAAARTRAYLAATDAAMRSLSRDGSTVLVSEAVIGGSVPDMTSSVAAAVKARMAQMPALSATAAPAAPASLPQAAPPAFPAPDALPNLFADPGDGN